jgi:hypothetical protein
MKKLLLPALLGLAGLIAAPAHALDATADFQVQINLYPKCELDIPVATLEVEYVSFQTDAVQKDLPFTVKCTTGIAYNLSIVDGSDAAATSGTLVGLPYTVGVVTASSTGTGAAANNNIRVNIAANLSGDCGAGQDNSLTTGPQALSSGTGGATAGNGTACSATSAIGDHVLKVVY